MMAPRGAGGAMGYNTMNDSYNGGNGINWGGLAGKAAAGALVFGVGATAHNRMKGASGMYTNGSNFLGEAWRNAKAPLMGNGWDAMRTQKRPLGESIKKSRFEGLHGARRGPSYKAKVHRAVSPHIRGRPLSSSSLGGKSPHSSFGVASPGPIGPARYPSSPAPGGVASGNMLLTEALPLKSPRKLPMGSSRPKEVSSSMPSTWLSTEPGPSDLVSPDFSLTGIDRSTGLSFRPMSEVSPFSRSREMSSRQARSVSAINQRKVSLMNEQTIRRRMPSISQGPKARSPIKPMRGARASSVERSVGEQAAHFFGAGDFAGRGAMRGGVGAMRIGGAIGAVGLGIYGAMAAKDFIFG